MKHHKRERGFSIITVILVVAAMAAVGFAGWQVYQHNRPEVGNATTETNQSANNNKPVTTEPGATVKDLEIKEWNVKLPLSETIKDAYYVDGGSSEGTDSPSTILWLGLASRSNANCNPSNNNKGERGALGALLRISPAETDAVSGELLTEKYPNGTTIGDYYYAYQSWKKDNPCASESELEAIDTAFAAAAKRIAISIDSND